MAIVKCVKQTVCGIYFTNIDTGYHGSTSEQIRNVLLAKLLCRLGVYLVIEQLFNQTVFVSYFTKIHPGSFIILPVFEADTT